MVRRKKYRGNTRGRGSWSGGKIKSITQMDIDAPERQPGMYPVHVQNFDSDAFIAEIVSAVSLELYFWFCLYCFIFFRFSLVHIVVAGVSFLRG